MAVHDSVLATKTYSRTYGLAADIAARAQQTWLFSKAAAMAPPAVVDTGARGGQRAESGRRSV